MKTGKVCLLAIVLASFATPFSHAQLLAEVTTDPSQVKIHYYDLHNFNVAVEIVADGNDAIQTMKNFYLDRASNAFRDQINSREIKYAGMVSRGTG